MVKASASCASSIRTSVRLSANSWRWPDLADRVVDRTWPLAEAVGELGADPRTVRNRLDRYGLRRQEPTARQATATSRLRATDGAVAGAAGRARGSPACAPNSAQVGLSDTRWNTLPGAPLRGATYPESRSYGSLSPVRPRTSTWPRPKRGAVGARTPGPARRTLDRRRWSRGSEPARRA